MGQPESPSRPVPPPAFNRSSGRPRNIQEAIDFERRGLRFLGASLDTPPRPWQLAGCRLPETIEMRDRMALGRNRDYLLLESLRGTPIADESAELHAWARNSCPEGSLHRHDLAFREDLDSYRIRRETIERFDDLPTFTWPDDSGDEDRLSGACATLVGCDGEMAWALRDELLERFPHRMVHVGIGLSLAGLESDPAWEMRERCAELSRTRFPSRWPKALVEEKRLLLLACSLAGCDSDRAWELRRMLDDGPPQAIRAQALAISLVGLSSDRAWKIRDELDNRALPEWKRNIFATMFCGYVFSHWRLGLELEG